jgi:two-component system, OmpR family, flagellar system response regulator FtcR
MIIFLDTSNENVRSFCRDLSKEGLSATGFAFGDFSEWFLTLNAKEISAIETIIIGDYATKSRIISLVKAKSNIPVIAINPSQQLNSTLTLFAAGADDVVSADADMREISARIGAIRRRNSTGLSCVSVGLLNIFFDGRDPEIDGVAIMLPRRERRILEYLAANRSRRVNRDMIFNAVYGLFEDEVEESVVESHISKLRKKLKNALDFDPIDNQRYLGYQLIGQSGAARHVEIMQFPRVISKETHHVVSSAMAA